MRRHQRGYIEEKHGAFHLKYYVEVDDQRKQKSIKLCDKNRNAGHGSKTASAVVMLADDFLRRSETERIEFEIQRLQKLLAPASPSVVDFWSTTFVPFVEQNLKHSTVMGYKQVWNQHLKKHFGSGLLKDYETPMMSNYLTTLSKTLGPHTLTHIKALASSIFSHAVSVGAAKNNPIRDAKVLGKMLPKGETKAYTLEEIENVISALVDHVECQLIMALAFFLGLRKGEIAGLQWGDVDAEFVHVRRAIGRGLVGTPKTRKSTRSVPLIAPVRLFLGLWRQKSASYTQYLGVLKQDDGWVFPGRGDGPANLDRLADRMKPILAARGLPWKGYHAGRRGLGTTLRSLTGNSNAGRDMLGHSNAQVTEAHYEAAMPDEVLRGMKLLEGKVKL